jgi:hypothetical protein
MRELIGAPVELSITQGRIFENNSHSLRRPPRLLFKQLVRNAS